MAESSRKLPKQEVTQLTGECFCGRIRYTIHGPLKDARSCHCSRCRKAFSSQASSYALVDPSDFQWLQGSESLTSYESQPGFGLQFCRICGSTLCGIFDGKIHGITLGCLNEDPDIEVGYHIFTGSRARWEVLPEHVTAYTEGKPDDVSKP